ncbi:16S rRNA (cytidine(1402)-2'-O)-methyltransferase [Alkalimarinus alittae]|uniref:Ribosomal RNA small subunit methyltransferase I n=1 Tax=Alkalimarinus alittae TaxID=2961619 RepID=A0ABY6N0P8_9ALTE|nr:16S rRNA (cytidine(1402)-2'-O)-methyltransferase [Alkalimarinus alittae]UZE95569.1 16S rRNA (cytidine(1402)-2'-O)-methyltransferase [Alkalimarinus alittae]
MNTEASLYIVATPIGNLDDITLRAVEILKKVDFIAAEDTRHSQRLMNHLGVTARMMALHEHNERDKSQALIDKIKEGKSIALVSDAGTPLISDPGYFLVKLAREQGVRVVPIPGVSAVVTALSVSGLPSDRFVFEGFLPAKQGGKIKRLEAFLYETRTVIFYESPHRIVDTLEAMDEVYGSERYLVIARELTKTFETIKGDSLGALREWVDGDLNQQKGEFVLLLEGVVESPDVSTIEQDKMLTLLMAEMPIKKASKIVSELVGGNKKDLYQRALEKQGRAGSKVDG